MHAALPYAGGTGAVPADVLQMLVKEIREMQVGGELVWDAVAGCDVLVIPTLLVALGDTPMLDELSAHRTVRVPPLPLCSRTC